MYLQVKATLDKYIAVWNGNLRLSADISAFLLNLTTMKASSSARRSIPLALVR